MKKFLSVLMAVVIAMSMLVVAPETAQAGTMSISETSRTITEKQQFRLYVKYCTSKVKWSSKDKSIAKVTGQGIVTGVKAGTTTILAKAGKSTYKCKVTVITAMTKELTVLAARFSHHYLPGHYVNPDKITIQSISKGEYVMDQGGISVNAFDYKIEYSGYLDNGTEQASTMLYNSTRDQMADYGGAWSTVRTLTDRTDRSFDESDVQAVEERARLIAGGSYDPDADDGKIKLDNTDLTLCVGETYKLKVKNTTQKAKWSSGKTSVATVSNGKVTAKKPGTAKIKAVVDGVTVYATVYVVKKYSKDMKTLLHCLGKIKYQCAYPDDFEVTGIQLGTFKDTIRNYPDDSENLFIWKVDQYFAMVSIRAKTVKGETYEGYIGIAHNDQYNWSADYFGDENSFSAENVTKCSAAEVKAVNELVKNGKARLLIL